MRAGKTDRSGEARQGCCGELWGIKYLRLSQEVMRGLGFPAWPGVNQDSADSTGGRLQEPEGMSPGRELQSVCGGNTA